MKIQWQKPLIDKRMIVVLLLEVLLLISSLALYFDQQNSKLLRQVHDPVMTVFIGAMPDRFASSQLWWLLLWVGFMSLPIFICAGVTDAYQRNLYTFLSLRMAFKASGFEGGKPFIGSGHCSRHTDTFLFEDAAIWRGWLVHYSYYCESNVFSGFRSGS